MNTLLYGYGYGSAGDIMAGIVMFVICIALLILQIMIIVRFFDIARNTNNLYCINEELSAIRKLLKDYIDSDKNEQQSPTTKEDSVSTTPPSL